MVETMSKTLHRVRMERNSAVFQRDNARAALESEVSDNRDLRTVNKHLVADLERAREHEVDINSADGDLVRRFNLRVKQLEDERERLANAVLRTASERAALESSVAILEAEVTGHGKLNKELEAANADCDELLDILRQAKAYLVGLTLRKMCSCDHEIASHCSGCVEMYLARVIEIGDLMAEQFDKLKHYPSLTELWDRVTNPKGE